MRSGALLLTVIRRRTTLIATKLILISSQALSLGAFLLPLSQSISAPVSYLVWIEDHRLRGSCLLLRSVFLQVLSDDITQTFENVLVQC